MKVFLNLPLKFWRLALATLILAGALLFFYRVRQIFLPFLLGALLAYLLKPWAAYLEAKGLSRSAAILVLYGFTAIAAVPLAVYVFPQLLRELNHFIDQVPRYTLEIQRLIDDFNERYQRLAIPVAFRRVIGETLGHFEALALDGARAVGRAVMGLLSGAASLILAPILAYYFLRDRDLLARTAIHILPLSWREDFLGIWKEIDQVLTNFIRGHLLVSVIVGLLTGIGFNLIGLEYAVILGIVVGLADLIPYFGPILGAIPAVALALLESKWAAFYALIVVLVVQQIEGSILVPRIIGDCVGLHPLTIIFVLLAGGELFGVLGLLLAVPVAGIGRILLRFIWSRLVVG
ncbi:MAG: hypothetical protein PWP65_1716 [Clostridia bacterium]|nr:hypothetical protein [Clostridia bacterium]